MGAGGELQSVGRTSTTKSSLLPLLLANHYIVAEVIMMGDKPHHSILVSID